MVSNIRQWPIIAARLANPKSEDPQSVLNTLLIAQAHKSVGGDIFITKSQLLLSNRRSNFVRETNPRTPLESSRFAGLFLRSRNNYTHSAGLKTTREIDREGFYWVLARHRLPNMWRYFAACVHAAKLRHDDLDALGEAILKRAVRALEALDAIGIKFYALKDRDDFLEILYHFDYLTLLLAGAIDAQARVANRAYDLRKQERSSNFRHQKFVKDLKENDAKQLFELTSSVKFQCVLTLLYELRNTIHGAAPRDIVFQDYRFSSPNHKLELPDTISDKLLIAAKELGGTEKWGLEEKIGKVFLEPYSYASALTDASFEAIDNFRLSKKPFARWVETFSVSRF